MSQFRLVHLLIDLPIIWRRNASFPVTSNFSCIFSLNHTYIRTLHPWASLWCLLECRIFEISSSLTTLWIKCTDYSSIRPSSKYECIQCSGIFCVYFINWHTDYSQAENINLSSLNDKVIFNILIIKSLHKISPLMKCIWIMIWQLLFLIVIHRSLFYICLGSLTSLNLGNSS